MTTYDDPPEMTGDDISAEAAAPAKPPPPTADEVAAAEKEVLDAANALDALMAESETIKNETGRARSLVAAALRNWMAVAPGAASGQDLARAFIANSQAERMAKANGEAPVKEPERKVFLNPCDAVGQRDNSAEGHVRGRIKTGNSRGAYPSTMRGGQIVTTEDGRKAFVKPL